MIASASTTTFPQLVHDFFCQRLTTEQSVSRNTVSSYRDAFRLLLRYLADCTGKPPSALMLEDLDAPSVIAFLDHLERERGSSSRTRNTRLAAIHSFMKYASLRDPSHLPTAQRVLAIPTKRFDRQLLEFLSREEVNAILSAPDRSVWSGLRDHVMFTVLYNTGARVSEIIGLRLPDVELERAPAVHLHGKGRKERAVPLWRSTAALLKKWLCRLDTGCQSFVFPNRTGKPLSRSGVEHRLRVAVQTASQRCPALRKRRVSPHTFRHTTAMHLLQSGVDITVIALWLGHERPATTHLYVEADLKMKERALEKLSAPPTGRMRFRAHDQLLAFLEGL